MAAVATVRGAVRTSRASSRVARRSAARVAPVCSVAPRAQLREVEEAKPTFASVEDAAAPLGALFASYFAACPEAFAASEVASTADARLSQLALVFVP
eukprot:CAMPEP_0183795848 /NCGR_PEP_ID=MMETSP0803_2-20130417/5358_1 /TAXON_ID=195967 /ORGANISM="Crustomastix stigmata, Strain CCMP3273" /LENGTH=97 /DNA_ID=CAMNT_0026040355 /DNA_START=31 /DNA_END=321 /DNA_ORIENTATION=+